jgi:hypothetical protein
MKEDIIRWIIPYKIFSILLTIREVKVKTTLRFHCVHVKKKKLKNLLTLTSAVENTELLSLLCITVGNVK